MGATVSGLTCCKGQGDEKKLQNLDVVEVEDEIIDPSSKQTKKFVSFEPVKPVVVIPNVRRTITQPKHAFRKIIDMGRPRPMASQLIQNVDLVIEEQEAQSEKVDSP